MLLGSVMNMLHCGHAGSAAMKSQATNTVFWPHIHLDIEQITKLNCTFHKSYCKPMDLGKDYTLIGQVQ